MWWWCRLPCAWFAQPSINGHAGNQAQSTTPYGPWSQVISIAKPFSSFPHEAAFKLLGTILEYVEEDDNEFQLAVYDNSTPLPPELDECVGMKTYGDVMSFVGKELALRCLRSRHPADHVKEASRRELISPILFGAATLSGWCINTKCGPSGHMAGCLPAPCVECISPASRHWHHSYLHMNCIANPCFIVASLIASWL